MYNKGKSGFVVPSSSLDFLYPSFLFALESYQTCQVIFSLGSLEVFILLLFELVQSHPTLGKSSFS